MAVRSSPETLIVQRGDTTIEAFGYGHGDETVILAAGLARPADQVERLASELATEGIRAITFNYRGIGGSTGPIDGLTLHDLADDVWAIADRFGSRRVHLAGKTYGNRVMRTAASDQPDRTVSITLIGAGGQILPSEEVQTAYLRLLDPSISSQEWTELNATVNYAPGNEHLAAAAIELGTFPDVMRSQLEASNSTPLEEWVSGGSAPMLVIVGLQDRVAVPANGLALATERPETWLLGIPHCGHNMVDEQPETLSHEIARFIERNSG